MPSRHAVSKWIRIAAASLLAVAGVSGVVLAWNAGRAQERYFRYKYGHMKGTRFEVPPMDFSIEGADRERLPEIQEAVEAAYARYPENHYFSAYLAKQCLIAALMDDDPVAFRRHFGAVKFIVFDSIRYKIRTFIACSCHIHKRIQIAFVGHFNLFASNDKNYHRKN